MSIRTTSLFLAMVFTTATATAAEPEVQLRVELRDPSPRPAGHTCTAWASEAGFRTDQTTAAATTQSVEQGGQWICQLVLPRQGTYAIAIMDDANGNGRVDTSWLGAPLEGWGTSNNVAPTFRAPSFEESAVEVSDGIRLSIEIRR